MSRSYQETKSIIIQGLVFDLFDLWSNIEKFPKFIPSLKSVKKTGEKSSHWVIAGPQDTILEWDAEVTRVERPKRIAWSSPEGDLKISGQATFVAIPGGEVEVTLTLHVVPSSKLSPEMTDQLFGDLEEQLLRVLRNFKAFAEGMPERIVS
jgi:uncharacterized membrane protein